MVYNYREQVFSFTNYPNNNNQLYTDDVVLIGSDSILVAYTFIIAYLLDIDYYSVCSVDTVIILTAIFNYMFKLVACTYMV